MRTPMDEATFLEFYKNTLLCGSNNFQRFICKKLELDNKITFEEQRKLSDSDETLFFESKKDFKGIITKTATSRAFSSFYEEMEYKKLLEIRYDSMRYSYNEQVDKDAYSKIVMYCVEWIKDTLGLKLFACEHTETIRIINNIQNTEVRMYKQMMEMKSGGSAELTAAENGDYVLPFIGEIRELIDENEDLFSEADEVKQLLLQYLNEKEATASYPYIYVKWVKPVETQSYIVKITFDYFNNRYTLLQHITGSCKDLGMGRMNDAIEYLSVSGSFVKGEEI